MLGGAEAENDQATNEQVNRDGNSRSPDCGPPVRLMLNIIVRVLPPYANLRRAVSNFLVFTIAGWSWEEIPTARDGILRQSDQREENAPRNTPARMSAMLLLLPCASFATASTDDMASRPPANVKARSATGGRPSAIARTPPNAAPEVTPSMSGLTKCRAGDAQAQFGQHRHQDSRRADDCHHGVAPSTPRRRSKCGQRSPRMHAPNGGFGDRASCIPLQVRFRPDGHSNAHLLRSQAKSW